MARYPREDPRTALPQIERHFNEKFDAIIDVVYPVGTYYETSDADFNPNKVWRGTWVLESGRWHRTK